ncbi:DUF4167 domain-containing protein [Roseiarcus sp.]|uniref:DUF4167 domain-containing protein n=1 Tax=Roseiarcus sp. TaxID=1969460 RepID=UPI003F9E9760
MRPGQNKRMRGRPTNGRRGPNPLTRSYESNGPDVKIRGNAQHVAEKYLQLARDAHTGGDPVAAENYLQHAEHYFRIIAAAQAAQAMAQSGQPRPIGESDVDDLEDDDDFSTLSDRFASPSERAGPPFQPPQGAFQGQPGAPNAPQPFVERPPFEGDRQGQNDRGGFQPRQDRQGNRFQDRGPRQDRPFVERGEGYRDNRPNRDGRPREFRPYREIGPQQPPREGAPPEPVGAGVLPSFITGPARPSVAEADAPQPSIPEAAPPEIETSEAAPTFGEAPAGEARFPPRGRRRRLRSPYGFNAAQSDQDPPAETPNPMSDDSPVNE